MENFISIKDVEDLPSLIRLVQDIKSNPYRDPELGKNKSIGLVFLNPSLRTRLSTQRAALNLGLNVMMMNLSSEGWSLETEDGVVMDGEKAEHIREAAAVIGRYCEIIAIRSFPNFSNREAEYKDEFIYQIARYSGRPVINLESAIRHPLQSLADMVTIEELKLTKRPRVVLTWAPHPKILPQSVPNSFAEWALAMNYDLVITHPDGYELAETFTRGAAIIKDQDKALEGADFVYVKNWSSYREYGKILSRDLAWTFTMAKLKLTRAAKVLHCLPVRRNMVITDEVLDSPHSEVIREAENRTYAAQAVIKKILMGISG